MQLDAVQSTPWRGAAAILDELRANAGHVVLPSPGPNGYTIVLAPLSRGMFANFGGLVQEFDDRETAAQWVRRCYEEPIRLEVRLAGNTPYRWGLMLDVAGQGCVELLAYGEVRLRALLGPRRLRCYSNYRGAACGGTAPEPATLASRQVRTEVRPACR